MAASRRAFSTFRFWVILSLCLVAMLFGYYVASDRITPMTSDAYVQAVVTPVAPLVSGEVVEVFVTNGSQVQKGDPLFRIDPRGFQHQIDQLEAQLAQISQGQDRRGRTTDGDAAAAREIEARLGQAKLAMTQSTVLAPADGIIDNMQLSAGAYTAAGTAVMTLVQAENWWIVANYEENALSVIRAGQPVEFGLYLYPGQVFSGQVETIGWGVEKGQGQATGNLPEIGNPSRWVSLSQRFQVRITPNGPIAQTPQRVGATARVAVYTQENSVMNALAEALMRLSAFSDYVY